MDGTSGQRAEKGSVETRFWPPSLDRYGMDVKTIIHTRNFSPYSAIVSNSAESTMLVTLCVLWNVGSWLSPPREVGGEEQSWGAEVQPSQCLNINPFT